MSNTSRCPKCGSLVQATYDNSSKDLSFGEKCIKKSIKKSVCEVVNPGAAIGAAIGSVIPGVGTFAGSVVGGVINDIAFDIVYGKAKETLSSNNCMYQCPKCGHIWTDNDDMMDVIDEGYEDNSYEKDDFDVEAYEKEEKRKYEKRENYFWNNIDEIAFSSENVRAFVEQYYSKGGSCYKDEITSKHYVLNALACLFYLNDHKSDKGISLLGKDCIKIAKNTGDGHDKELMMIEVMFAICCINPQSGDIVALQKSIAKKAPKRQTLNSSRFLKPEYLYRMYEAYRFQSLHDTRGALLDKENYKDAFSIFEMMQDLENPDYKLVGYGYMADAYLYGKGVEVSYEKSCYYSQKCIDQKSFDTPYQDTLYIDVWATELANMADRSMYGRGRSVDYAYAFKCAKKSADLNNVIGFFNLGEIYENGFGVQKDYYQAINWYNKVLDSDDDSAKEYAQEKINAIRSNIALEPQSSDTSKSNPQSNTSLIRANNDEDYLEEVKACLEDGGSITASERRLLNKLRERLGISIEHAEELEASLASIQLTPEEKEYLEEYKACLEDGGTITSGERRLLNRMSSSYGISNERVKEIEASVN